jgi:hypothetical protein
MGRGRRGKKFRRTVSGLPTAQFRNRLAAMACEAGLWIIAVDPAYTSRSGAQQWLKPLQQNQPHTRQDQEASVPSPSGHHGAAVAIGRRAHTIGVKRKRNGPRHGHRTMPGQRPVSFTGTRSSSRPGKKAGPNVNPTEVTRSDRNHSTPSPNTVRGANRAGPTPA